MNAGITAVTLPVLRRQNILYRKQQEKRRGKKQFFTKKHHPQVYPCLSTSSGGEDTHFFVAKSGTAFPRGETHTERVRYPGVR